MVDQPIYEVIKREDLIGAFNSALRLALEDVLERINTLIELYAAIQTASLWTWGYSSRWDYDMWW